MQNPSTARLEDEQQKLELVDPMAIKMTMSSKSLEWSSVVLAGILQELLQLHETYLWFLFKNMAVSKNSSTPKSSILIGFSIINHPFWGTPIVGNTHI